MMDWNKITENTNLRCSYITMPTCHIWHDIKSGFPQNNGEKQVNEVLIQVESTIYKCIFIVVSKQSSFKTYVGGRKMDDPVI